jgi:hypothetical protein
VTVRAAQPPGFLLRVDGQLVRRCRHERPTGSRGDVKGTSRRRKVKVKPRILGSLLGLNPVGVRIRRVKVMKVVRTI